MKLSNFGKLTSAAAMLCAMGMAPQAGAAVVLNGCSGGDFGNDCSLGELLGGGSIVINDKTFSGFNLSLFAGSALNTGSIRVDTIDALYNPGLTLVSVGGALLRTDGDFTQNDLSFVVNVTTGDLRIKDNSLAVAQGALSGDGSFTNVFENTFDATVTDFLSNNTVFCDNTTACAGNTGSAASGNFATQSGVAVFMGIDVVADVGGTAEINSLTVQFSQVPLPGTLALFGLGLAGVGVARRRLSAA